MKCHDAWPLIEAAVEQDRQPGNAADHLESCTECRERWEDLQALRSELAAWGGMDSPDVELATVRTEVLRKLAARPQWGPRLGWAVLAIAVLGSTLTSWNLSRPQPMPELIARFEAPKPPEMGLEKAERQPRVVEQPPVAAPEPEPLAVTVAAVIPPDAEAETTGGVMLELESKNPNVVLYFMADNQGD